jgi:hypothetical protein
MRQKRNLEHSAFHFYEKELFKCVQPKEWKLVLLSMRAVIHIYILVRVTQILSLVYLGHFCRNKYT